MCHKSNTTGATCGTRHGDPSGNTRDNPQFQLGSWCSIFRFLCSVLQIGICPIVILHLAIALSLHFRFTAFDHPFDIFKLFLYSRHFAIWILCSYRYNHLLYEYNSTSNGIFGNMFKSLFHLCKIMLQNDIIF